jgi:hypothetical protein
MTRRIRSEEVCRRLFQHFVQRPFISCRPSFLGKLELDGYCKYHELAFEYNGIQHYQWLKQFHPTKKEFERQLERDFRKQNLCREYGLILCVIPFQFNNKTVQPMAHEIYRQLLEAEKLRKEIYMVNRSPHSIPNDINLH